MRPSRKDTDKEVACRESTQKITLQETALSLLVFCLLPLIIALLFAAVVMWQ